MNRVNVSTSQYVSLEFTLANIGDRILGSIIDFAIVFFYTVIVNAFILSRVAADAEGGNETIKNIVYLVTIPILFYSFLMELFFNGQTVGKMVMKTRVIREDGLQPSIGNYFLRWVLRIMDIWISAGVVGIISSSMSPKWQRLGDMAAGTLVIKLKRKVSLEETMFARYDPHYSVEFPEAEKLTDNNISLIKEVLAAYEKEDNFMVLDSMSQKLKDVLNVDYMGSNKEFLQTILKDYTHIYQAEK